MHPTLTEEIVKVCRQRDTEGDCPTVEAPGRETLEFAVLELAQQRDNAKQTAFRVLGEAMMKFAPDLAKELARRWGDAKAAQDKRLDDFLAVLRESHS